MPLLFNYYSLSLVLGGFIALISGIVVLYKDSSRSENITWFLLNVSSAVWSFGYFVMISANSRELAFLANWVLHQGAILITFFYFFFILALTRTYHKHRLAFFIVGAGAVIFSVLNPTPLFIKDVFPKFIFHYAPDAGALYKYFTFYFFAPSIYAFFILFRESLRSSREEAQRFKFVLTASFAGFLGGGSVFLLTFNVPVPPFPLILFSLYPIIIAYAILRHHLFDIRVIATELLVFSIWIFLLVRTILADTLRERLIDGGLLALVIFFGILLIRAVLQEVRQRGEIERLADSLRKANAELKKLDQLKSEFLSLASHQLRTPLSIIKGYISMIQEGSFGSVPDKAREVLRKVYFSNERMINLVNDFLNISRIESGRMQYDFESAKVEDVIENVVGEFKEAAHDKKIDLMWERPQTSLPEAMLDKEKFHQVIMNLVDNALRYTQVGFIKIMAEPDSIKSGHILISVRDSGVGMTPEEIDQTFRRFSRGEGGSRVNTGGLGLGLYLAKRIVNDHGGEIWAESKGRGQGSTFLIRLPARAREVKRAEQFNAFVEKI